MQNKLLLWIFVFLLMMAVASAQTVDISNITYSLKMDNNSDATPNARDVVVFNAVVGEGIIDGGYAGDGGSDYLRQPWNFDSAVGGLGWLIWLKANASDCSADADIWGGAGSGDDDWFFRINTANNNEIDIFVRVAGSFTPLSTGISDTDFCDGNWHQLVVTYNESNTRITAYTDGTYANDSGKDLGGSGWDPSSDLSIWLGGAHMLFGRYDSGGLDIDFQGNLDGATIWQGHTPTQDEITITYNVGLAREYNYSTAPPPPVGGDFWLPKVTEADQAGSINVNSPTYVPIITGSVEITNLTNISLSATGFVEGRAGSDSIANCQITFNGTQVGNTSTSPPQNNHNSFFANTEVIEATAGNYSVALNCRRDGANLFQIENSKLVITQYLTGSNKNMHVRHDQVINNITSSVYQEIGNFTFTTSNETQAENTTRYIVYESSTTNAYNSTGTTCLMASSFGLNSSEYCRFGEAGKTGSGSAFELVVNVTNQTEVTVQLFAKSTTSDGMADVNIITYEIISHPNEINFTPLNDSNITSDVYTTVASVNISNVDHASITSIVKAGFSVQSNSGSSDMRFRLTLSGDSIDNGTEIRRDVLSANQEGLVSLQEIFTGLGMGDYTINLQARASNSDSAITGGEMTVISGNNVAFSSLSYNVTAHNVWDNQTVFSFNVTNQAGTQFQSDNSTGIAIAVPIGTFDNLTIAADNYFVANVLNHNTAGNLNQSLVQSDIKFEGFQKVTGLFLDDVNFTVEGVTKAINDSFFLSAGNHTVTASKTGYFDSNLTITVSAFDNLTFNVSLGNARINITPFNFLSGSSVSTFSVLFNYSAGGFSEIFNTSSTSLVVDLIQGNFTITFFKPGYLNTSEVINVNATFFNVSLAVYASTNISVNFFDEETLLPVNDVDFDILGSVFSSAFNTGAGNNSILLTDLPEDLYHIRYTADEYSARSYYVVVPITSSEFSNISLFLVNDSIDDIFTRNVVGQDAIPLDGSYLELQRPYPSTDNTSLIYRTMELAIIDSQGDAVFSAIPNTQQYRFRILDDDLNLLNVLTPSFLIDTTGEIIADESLSTMLDFNTAGDVVGSLSFQNSTSFFIFDYTAPLTVTETCLRVTNKTGFSSSQVTVCLSDPLGTIAIFVNTNNSVTYEALAYVVIDGQQFAVDTLTLDLQFIGEKEALRYIGPFLYFLSVLMFGAMSFIKPAIGIFGIVGVTFAFSLQFLGLFWFSTGLIGGLVVLGIIIALVAEKGD